MSHQDDDKPKAPEKGISLQQLSDAFAEMFDRLLGAPLSELDQCHHLVV